MVISVVVEAGKERWCPQVVSGIMNKEKRTITGCLVGVEYGRDEKNRRDNGGD